MLCFTVCVPAAFRLTFGTSMARSNRQTPETGENAGRPVHPSRDLESGPHMRLVAAMVKLARRDLAHPEFSAGARAFLRGEPFEGNPVAIDLTLFADAVGYGGRWDR